MDVYFTIWYNTIELFLSLEFPIILKKKKNQIDFCQQPKSSKNAAPSYERVIIIGGKKKERPLLSDRRRI